MGKESTKRRIVTIEDSQDIQPSFYCLIKEMETKFKGESCTIQKNDLIDNCQNDFLIKKWVEDFKKSEITYAELIKKFKETWIHPRFITHSALPPDEFNTLVNCINNLNSKRKELRDNIIERQKILSPATDDCDVLTSYLSAARVTLEKSLEFFLQNFIAIEFNKEEKGSSAHPDTIFFTEQLERFTDDLFDELKKNKLPVNHGKNSDFRDALLNHFGKKTNKFRQILSEKTGLFKTDSTILSPDEVNGFVRQLFHPATMPPKKDKEKILKEQIRATYHLIAKVEDFPIRMIKDYHGLKAAQNATDEKIHLQYGEMQKKIIDLSKYLEARLKLFTVLFDNSPNVKEGHKTLEQLQTLKSAMEATFNDYKQNTNKLLTIQSPLDRLRQITDSQEKALNDLKKSVASRENEEKILENGNRLESEYRLKRRELARKLHTALENTSSALGIHNTEASIQDMLKEQQNHIAKLELDLQDENLHCLDYQVEQHLKFLNARVEETRTKIKEEYARRINGLKTINNSFINFPLHDTNPFKEKMSLLSDQIPASFTKIDVTYQTINETPASEMSGRFLLLSTQHEGIKKLLGKRLATSLKAAIIEERLNSEAYTTSRDIIATLRNEYLRVLAGHVEKAIQKFPEHAENLTKIRDNPPYFLDNGRIIADSQTSLLHKIDPRLNKLVTMHFQFNQINNSYINSDLKKCSDNQYWTNLIKNVEDHMHNSHMEDISDEKRPQFIQWIRKNLLKPLQAFKHQLGVYIKSVAPSHRFFATVGACKTERDLVEIGNEAYNKLQTSAPAV